MPPPHPRKFSEKSGPGGLSRPRNRTGDVPRGHGIYSPGMPVTTQVAVAKESLGFSAAHFLTLPGHLCERLHGHNYRVSVVVEGPVDPATGFVLDFAVLKRVLRALIEPMDHRVLLPGRNPRLVLREEGEALVVDYLRPGWLTIPRDHACVVPVTNTTAELLAEHLESAVRAALGREGIPVPHRLAVEVEESAGQSATARFEG